MDLKINDDNDVRKDDVEKDDVVKENDIKDDQNDVMKDDVKKDDVKEDDVNEDDVKEDDVKDVSKKKDHYQILTNFDKFLNQLKLVEYDETSQNLNDHFFDHLSPKDFESFIKENPKVWQEYKSKLFLEFKNIENPNIYVPYLFFKSKFGYDLIDSSPIDHTTYTEDRNEVEQIRKKFDFQIPSSDMNKIFNIIILSLLAFIFVGIIIIIIKLFI